ncbi:UNVERIFIED_CONTAM: Protease Do-like 7 [Sesamum radiatum]|uniref:Protease Do-like 7 n=1 Tax=Sesamum radiatum TaxID=300843 RepID=A0AAW2VQ11_SESRA
MERLGSEAALAGMETSMKEELCMEIDPPFKENLATADDWRKALNKVVQQSSSSGLPLAVPLTRSPPVLLMPLASSSTSAAESSSRTAMS